ncbi:MAG: Isoleucyl-tRNA synthetase [Microgenomates group bacterium GW2011_GWA2_44_7]|uniref:Isoleucine--tRNA ligase n=1 Tax=Candidatus Woesebacteria bacterium GW2011_GWA1_43_12 TaxID=1618557 RepID=A0A0G1CYP9_9BACT|nr:MAG: Isoleucyl-tRNA synthetase [Candidatus Woesebacteria bacterium GW2011_GWA1_43_12]KKT75862.1 MAG: Isoleucyl-tRNA synthetase [Microgenomates group bacterium GW2011_GWA2_44_7]KKT78517.1 MAG: Isoleucyl-tRNA synthetase [Microgenomates group bacterium GW2011_GWB1_44_8]
MPKQKNIKTFERVDLKVDFPAMERRILEHWYKDGIVEKYLHKNDSSKKRFSFLDGPITANNPMGVHHAWGRTYKDLWPRFYNMLGFRQRFQNGFDCQGLWVEVEVEKELGFKSKKDIETYGVANFVNKCKERVWKYSTIQAEQSKRLGYFADWDNSYFTMSDQNNYMIWHFLKTCFERGWIYKGHDSVPWCPRCETAISQHEILTEDYKELIHESVIIEFPIVGRENEFLLVWTTTPWTIPANIAVAVDSKQNYALVQGQDKNRFWVAAALVKSVFKDSKQKILKTVKGKELVGLHYTGAFDDLEAINKVARDNPETFHIVVATDDLLMPISMEEGTGMVHTAVSAGEEDYQLGKKLGLPMIPVIADNADYLPGLGQFSGKNAKNNPRIILDYLEEREKSGMDTVFDIFKYKHRYPACWRCKTELVWKVADEWYISMDKKDPTDKKKRTLRQEMVDVASKITWLPGFGLDRELDWLKNMHDWLISKKNRYWGLALPIYECQKCGSFEVIGSREELKKRAVVGWKKFEGNTPHKPWIDEVKIKCQICSAVISRIGDVGNPWLDAGIVSFSTLIDPKTDKLSYTSDKKYWREWFPADFITESFPGQFKNWFYSLIAMSTVLEKTNPFKTVLGFATMVDSQGRPFHKSLGNAIDFTQGADRFGADIIRWYCELSNITQNAPFGQKEADDTRRRFYLTLWNVYNFFVTYSCLDNWHPRFELGSKPTALDLWILTLLDKTIIEVTEALEKYDASTAASLLEHFVEDLSLWYVRRSRDRVGFSALDKKDKDLCHATLYTVLVTLMKILAPFIPFLTEEIYTNLTGEESVHLADWPEVKTREVLDNSLIEQMQVIRQVAEKGLAQRKINQIKVRQPLAEVNVSAPGRQPSGELMQLLADELNIKRVFWKKGKDSELTVDLNTQLTPLLIEEGKARELVRQVQDKRKELGLLLDQKVIIKSAFIPSSEELVNRVLRQTLATKIEEGADLEVKEV